MVHSAPSPSKALFETKLRVSLLELELKFCGPDFWQNLREAKYYIGTRLSPSTSFEPKMCMKATSGLQAGGSQAVLCSSPLRGAHRR